MGKYQLPNVSISDDYNAHKRRNSAEPGTDYELKYGSAVYAPYGGKIRVANTSNAGAPGRYVGIDLADGNYFRALHMSRISVKVGQSVKKGQLIGYSGASGFSNDWHYGPHVHFSLWVGTDPLKSSWRNTTDIVKYSNSFNVGPVTRTTVTVGANGRSAPKRSAKKNQLLKGPGKFDAYTVGEKVEGNDIWFRGFYSHDWFWSGGFTSKSTAGMRKI